MPVNIQITKKVSIDMSGEDWELYTSSYPNECALAAHEINIAIETAFNEGKTQREVLTVALKVMRVHSHVGAMDSEPMYHLDKLMERLYARN